MPRRTHIYRSFLALSSALLLMLAGVSALQARAVPRAAAPVPLSATLSEPDPHRELNRELNRELEQALDRKQADLELFAWELTAVEEQLDQVAQRVLVPQAPPSELRHAWPPVAGLSGSPGPHESAPGSGRGASGRLPPRYFTFEPGPGAAGRPAMFASVADGAARSAFYFATHNGYF